MKTNFTNDILPATPAATGGAGTGDAKKTKKDKDPRPAALVKSERAINSILSSCERLERKGRGLTEAQKTACLAAVKGAVDHVEKVFGGKASAKAGFTLGE